MAFSCQRATGEQDRPRMLDAMPSPMPIGADRDESVAWVPARSVLLPISSGSGVGVHAGGGHGCD